MRFESLTKLYCSGLFAGGNFVEDSRLNLQLVVINCGITVSLLRSRFGRLAFNVIPERFSSSLPPLFASGRFATFLFFVR